MLPKKPAGGYQTKNRFTGIIRATFSDGFIEVCHVKEKADKGKDHFIDTVCSYIKAIIEQVPATGTVDIQYAGAFSMEITKLTKAAAAVVKAAYRSDVANSFVGN